MSATETQGAASAERPVEPAAPATARSLERVLGELGATLDRAFATQPPRRVPAVGRWALLPVLAVAAAGAAVGGYVLTRTAEVRTAQPLPALRGVVARASGGAVRWELAATPCSSAGGGFQLAVATADGSERTACASAVAQPASAFYDQAAGVALVFGTAPAGTRRVLIVESGGGAASAAVRRLHGAVAGVVGGRAVAGVAFVADMSLAQTVTALTAYGEDARLIEACNELRCVAP
jgi:hypothetical protein